MDLRQLSQPSDGDRTPARCLRARSTRMKLREMLDKEVRHLKNAAEHRGDKEAIAAERVSGAGEVDHGA